MRLQNWATYVGESIKLRPKILYVLAAVVLLLALDGRAWGQALWDTDVVTWTPPTACADGSPLSDCPITGYRLETATSATGTWTVVTTTTATSHTLTDLSPGQHCYRVIALSGAKASVSSNVACDSAVGPAPGAPTLKTVDTVAYEVKWKGFRFALGKPVGTVPLGTECHDTFRLDDYYQVDRDSVEFSRSTRSPVIVARCG